MAMLGPSPDVYSRKSSRLWILLLYIGLLAGSLTPNLAQSDEVSGKTDIVDGAASDLTRKDEGVSMPVSSSPTAETPEVEDIDVNVPPQIYSQIERVLKVGDNITIDCIGRKAVEWEFPRASLSPYAYNGPVEYSSASKLYSRKLHIENALWNLTGFYRCRYEDVQKWVPTTTTTTTTTEKPLRQNNRSAFFNGLRYPAFPGSLEKQDVQEPSAEETFKNVTNGDGVWASKVFIFVSDPQRPFQDVPGLMPVFEFVQYNRPFHFKCGVTDPSFQVRLFENNKDITEDSGTSWDPRTGFLIQFPTWETLNSPYCQVFTDAYPRPVGFQKRMHLLRGQHNGKPIQPYVTANKKSFLSGETVEITCKVKVDRSDLLYMYFNYTAKEQKLPRFDEKLPVREPKKNFDDIFKVLTISNVQVQDSGIYTCLTTTDNIEESKAVFSKSTVEIVVSESEFINITVPRRVVYAMDSEAGFPMTVYVHAAPNPKIEWLFEGKKLEGNPNFLQIYKQLTHQSKLLNENPKTEHSGIYTVRVTVESNNITMESSEQITFYVQGQPDVTVEAKSDDDGLPAHVVTVSAMSMSPSISCKVRGFPHSNISWFYQPCLQAFCEKSDNESSWEEIPNTGSNREENSGNAAVIVDRLNLANRRSGHYKCKAQNSYGNSSDALLVLVTGELGIQSVWDSSKRRLVKGDSLTLTCAVNKWLYSSVALHRKADITGSETAAVVGTANPGSGEKSVESNKTATGQRSPAVTLTMDQEGDQSIPAPVPNFYRAPVVVSADRSFVSAASDVTTPSSRTVEIEGLVNTTQPTTTTSFVPRKGRPKEKYMESEDMMQVSLMWDELMESDQGSYICVATSASENTTHSQTYTLTLYDIIPPQISDQTMGSRRVSIGSSTVFQCVMQGLPPPTTSWFKDGDQLNISDSDRYGISSQGNSLAIKNATLADEGNYQCMGSNYGGKVWSKNMTLLVGDASVHTGSSNYYIGIIIGIIVFIIILVAIIVKIKFSKTASHKDLEKFLIQPQGDYNPDLPIDEQTGCLPYDAKWEFPKDRLRLGMILGQGAFGRVMKAEAIGITDGEDVTVVAVKMVKDCTDKEQMMALLSELKILIHVGQHLNILNLLGAVTKDIRFGELYVIVEYCHFGNLRSYLIKNKDYFQDTMEDLDEVTSGGADGSKMSPPPYESMPASPTSPVSPAPSDKPVHEKGPYYVNKAGGPHGSAALFGPSLTTKNLYCWAFQVARGMEFLADRKYIHRDLAARNVLLSEDNIVKICDFGLAKDLYQDQEYFKKGDGPVPVKWMALESFTHRIYTTKSDVWSYGILLWELFSLGGNPYPGVEINEKFIGLLKSGYRMEKPPFATDDLYKLMLKTWKVEPEDRPTFSSLVASMGDFLESNVKQYYLDLSSPYMKMQGDGEGGFGDEVGDKTEESNILTDPDGYLKMSPTLGPDYSNILPNSPKATSFSQVDETIPTYVNQRRWKKQDEVDDMEMTPLTSGSDERKSSLPDALAPGFMPDGDNQVQTVAEVHQLEETDSGHSSGCEGAGLSPVMAVENNDYLIPHLPDLPSLSPPHVASQQPKKRPEIVPPIPAPPEGPKISLAAKLPPLRQAPSSSNTSRLRQPAPLRLTPASSSTAPSSMFQAAASTAPLTRSLARQKSEDSGDSVVGLGYRKRSLDGVLASSTPHSTSSTVSEPSSNRPTQGSLPKPSGAGSSSSTNPSSSSNLSWGNKRAGIPKMKDTSRVYTPQGGAGTASSSGSTTPTSPVAPTISNPVSKYTAWPLPPPDSSSTQTPSLNGSIVEGNTAESDASQPLLNGPLRTRLGNFRNGLNEGRFLSNASSGYNSDLSPAESTPPPDYRAVLEDATETDILV